jgi:hypothetical protein
MSLAIAKVLGYPAAVSTFETFENLTFLSFPRKRESMKSLKGLDSRLRGNDNLDRIRRNSKVSIQIFQGGIMSQHKKIERKKELDRQRRRRKKSLKLRAKEAKGKTR